MKKEPASVIRAKERIRLLSNKPIQELNLPQVIELAESTEVLRNYLTRVSGTERVLKLLLKTRLEHEQWTITSFSPDREKGIDIAASKGKSQLVIEVKGNPFSEKSEPGQKIKYLGDAVLSICTRMTEHSVDIRYCIAVPDTFASVITNHLPDMARTRLEVYVLFLNGEQIRVLYPSEHSKADLISFDQLF